MASTQSYTLSIIFIAMVVLTTFTRIWLGNRHISFVLNHRNQVPNAFSKDISLEAHQKAADYTSAKTKLVIAESIVQAALLLTYTWGGGLQWIDYVWRELMPDHEMLRGALVILSALMISGIIDTPFDYYKTFVIDAHFGFNKMTRVMYVGDIIKQTILGIALGAPILFAALWLMESAGEYW